MNSWNEARLQIAFPKSSEDHRLQLVEINGAIFAILHSPLESQGPIRLLCEDWSLILLAPIKSETNILISAINVMCLNEIVSEGGSVNIHATHRLVTCAHLIKSGQMNVSLMAEHGEFDFDDDPGAFLFHYRLLNEIMSCARKGTQESFSEAQHKFMTSLCTLADKMEGKPENLNLRKVLDIWAIPHLK